MARSHARLLVIIWADPEWRALPRDAQWFYELLLSQPTISHAGVITIPRHGWVHLSADDDNEQAIARAQKVLEERRFLVVDDATDEILVRSFIRNDGVAKGPPGTLKSALASAVAVVSPTIRAALWTELLRLDQVAIDKKQVPAGHEAVLKTLQKAIAALDPTPRHPQKATPSDGTDAPTGDGTTDAPGEGVGAGVGAPGSLSVELKLGGRASAHTRATPPPEPGGQAELGLIGAVPPLPAVAPRCRGHAKLPAGVDPPPCRACQRERITWERAVATTVDDAAAVRRARRAAIDACGRCDPETGTVTTPSGAVARCACNAPQYLRAVNTRAG